MQLLFAQRPSTTSSIHYLGKSFMNNSSITTINAVSEFIMIQRIYGVKSQSFRQSNSNSLSFNKCRLCTTAQKLSSLNFPDKCAFLAHTSQCIEGTGSNITAASHKSRTLHASSQKAYTCRLCKTSLINTFPSTKAWPKGPYNGTRQQWTVPKHALLWVIQKKGTSESEVYKPHMYK